MKKIFVSSTFEDLKEERSVIISALDQVEDIKVIAMERFPAFPDISKEYCIEQVQQSNALILIVGFSYGNPDPIERISLTEIEYNTAKTLNIPVFAFLKVKDDGKWEPNNNDPQKDDLLLKFKDRLSGDLGRRKFKNNVELITAVLTSIGNHQINNGEFGARIQPFMEGKEYFKFYMDNKKILHHLHPFFGREQNLAQLDNFILSNKRIAILYGRPTVGKSKILFEYCKRFRTRFPKNKIKFVRDAITLSADALPSLPITTNVLIVVDDAHTRSDLNFLLEVAKKFPDAIKLLFVTRSYARKSIESQIYSANFDSSDIEILPEIQSLGIPDLEKLGKNILGIENEVYLQPLLQITRDSTLFFIMGAKLLVNHEVSPLTLQKHDEFRRLLTSKFNDILVGNITSKFNPEQIKDVLKLVSILSPISPDNRDFQERASKFLGIEKYQLIDLIGVLEQTGILIRRGHTLIITPDILSDFILEQACTTAQGMSTTYEDKIYELFGETYLKNILLNLSKIDLKLSNTKQSTSLTDNIWQKKIKDFKTSSNLERLAFLNIVIPVASFLPEKSLELVEYTLKNPSFDNNGILSEITHEDIKRTLPKILQNIGYNLEFLPRCSDILWDLGKNQEGVIASTPHHPIRILSDFVDYDIETPPGYRKIILDHIERWLKDADAFDYLYSPIDVLEPIFKKMGSSAVSKGRYFSISEYYVDYEAVKDERQRALSILSRLIFSGSPKIVLRVLKSLFIALNPPFELNTASASQKIQTQWIPEQESVLDIISNLVNKTKNSIILIEINSNLQLFIWQEQKVDYEKDVVKKAVDLLKSIDDTPEIRLMRALLYKYDRNWEVDYDKVNTLNDEALKTTAQEFYAHVSSVDAIYTSLEQNFLEIKIAQFEPNPSRFLDYLAKINPDVTIKIAEKIIASPKSQISSYICAFLSNIRQNNTDKGISLIKLALNSNDINLIRQIAFGYSCHWWESGINTEDIDLVKQLLNSFDTRTRAYTIESIRFFPESIKEQALEILLNVDIGTDNIVAEALSRNLTLKIEPDAVTLTDKQLTQILLKFVHVPTLNRDAQGHGFFIRQFIRMCGRQIPEEVIKFILQRVEIAEIKTSKYGGNFEPIPIEGLRQEFEGIINHQKYEDILRSVRDCLLKNKPYTYNYWISRLYADLSDNFSNSCLKVLSEWIDGKNAEKIINVGTLIENASTNILFAHHDFISNLIETAYAVNAYCYDKILSSVQHISYSEVRSGFLGEPYPQDVKIKDNSMEIARLYPKGSPTEKFYRELSERAKKDIDYQLKMEEEFE
jgi:hypothetical protein